MKISEISEKENSCENYCHYCGGSYFDDDSDDEDWVKCSEKECNLWYMKLMEKDWMLSSATVIKHISYNA